MSEGELYLLSANVREIEIRRVIGNLDGPEELFEIAVDAGSRPLPVYWIHSKAATLPWNSTDPFDRMLTAFGT